MANNSLNRAPGRKRPATPEIIDLTADSPNAIQRQINRKVPRASQSSYLHSSQAPTSSSFSFNSSQVPTSSSFSFNSSSFTRTVPAPSNPLPPGIDEAWFDDEFFDDDWVEDDIDPSSIQTFRSLNTYTIYGTLETKIVGCRFYSGFVNPGEMVLMQREPQNQYDRNAIQVTNVRGEKIGHIPRAIAAKVAPFMDRKLLMVEGQTAGPKDYFDCPLEMKFYGTSDPVTRSNIKEQMKSARLPVQALNQHEREEKAWQKEQAKRQKEYEKQLKKARKGVSVGNGPGQHWDIQNSQYAASSSAALGLTLDEFKKDSEKFNPRSFDAMAEKFGLTEDALKDLPMARQPTGIQAKLLPFQLQGLRWMLNKESPKLPTQGSKDSVQLWKRMNDNQNMFTHMATRFSVKGPPALTSGGILADDMGLGKTLQVISLIIADRELGIHRQNGVASATLIVAPLSVMNWDVVVTTYDTIRSEHFGKQSKSESASGLSTITWRRIVLDEGHIIRNPAAKTSTAICTLKAQSRWSLTGTPIINSLKDLYSQIRFLRLSGGLDKWELFNSAIIRPLNGISDNAAQMLQTLMDSICLRRKKDMKFIDLKLPELSQYIHRIDFHDDEQEKYDALSAEAEGNLEDYRRLRDKAGADSSKAYRNLLEVLLRLRQLCNHWQLVGQKRFQELDGMEGRVLDLTPENRALLEKMLQLNIDAQDDCPVCIDTLDDPVITLCTHAFCFACIEKVVETQHKCPMCRAHLENTNQLVRPPTEASQPQMEFHELSSKVEALLSILKASQNGKGNKTVVFSQWTTFLDIIGTQLAQHGFKFVRIDGKMSADRRDAAMHALENDAEVTILLASLAVCSVGLNLVAANQVILADSWWAPAIEDQAVDRVHRLGQTRPTTVFRLVMSDSIEEKVLHIQERKRKLMMLAFAEKKANRGNEKGARLADIQTLLSKGNATAS